MFAQESLLSRWPEIEKAIIDGLHSSYNEQWSDPESGYSKLSESAFVAKVSLQTISVMDESALDLFFDDGNLFGGHTVNVFVTGDGKVYPAELFG